jgi:hypothetical protein
MPFKFNPFTGNLDYYEPDTTPTSPLPVTEGGTGTATQFTQGSVVFAGPSGVYAQDNTGLFYDDTNNRLGVGTASPSALIHIAGNTSAPAWGATGMALQATSGTYTDTTSSVTVSQMALAGIGTQTVAATNPTTYTNGSGLFISPPTAGANVTITTPWAATLNGNMRVVGNTSFGGNVATSSVVQIGNAQSRTSWTVNGPMFGVLAQTTTDTSGTGTIATRVSNSFGTPTFASTNPVTLTTASNLYIAAAPIAGSNTTITNALALQVAAGNSSFAANVGVGMTDPQSPLSVAASGLTVGTNEQIGLRSQRTALLSGSMVGGISFRSNDTNLTAPGTIVSLVDAIAEATHTGSVLTTGIAFQTTDTLTMAERMRIAGNGNVGIGIAVPTSLLHTSGAAAKTAAYTGVLHTVSDTSSTASIAKIGVSVQSTGTWNGASATNTGLAVNATGGTTNYAATFSGGNVGIGTTTPVASALLDVTSTTQGLLPPRMTTVQRDAIGTPAAGLVVYNTTTSALNVYNGAWVALSSGASLMAPIVVYRSSSLTALTGTVIMNAAVTNPASNYDTATGIFTAPTTGFYLFSWQVYFNGTGVSFALENNAASIRYSQGAWSTGGATASYNGTKGIPLTAGNTIVVRTIGSSDIFGNAAGDATYLTITQVS